MLVKAITNFAGSVTMHIGEVKDIKDKQIVNDLLKAKYVEPIVDTKPKKIKSKKVIESE